MCVLKERNGRMLVFRVPPISTFCSRWTLLFSSPNVWWTKILVCPGQLSFTLSSHFLYCTYIEICFCYRFKVSGELPLLHVKISDQKIQGVLGLVDSIPLPQSSSTPPSTPTVKVRKQRNLNCFSVKKSFAPSHTLKYVMTRMWFPRRKLQTFDAWHCSCFLKAVKM